MDWSRASYGLRDTADRRLFHEKGIDIDQHSAFAPSSSPGSQSISRVHVLVAPRIIVPLPPVFSPHRPRLPA
ncbi:hypothetical protein CGMCC3_g10750 [Colletotrichum fructicola]|nr:uncharacterized protein CGMCC3_g10750 [Colletotrichum fructicola]KAE9573299.1 hypothetical protein CGMCC3_g10750 [Colletotrichum fructicola]